MGRPPVNAKSRQTNKETSAWVPNGNMMRRTASEGGPGGLASTAPGSIGRQPLHSEGGLASPAPGSIGREPLRMPNDGSSDASRMYFHPIHSQRPRLLSQIRLLLCKPCYTEFYSRKM